MTVSYLSSSNFVRMNDKVRALREKNGPTVCSLTMPSETSGTTNVVWNSDTLYALGLCRMLEHTLGIWPLECQNLFSEIRLLLVAILEGSMAINLMREVLADCVAIEEMVTFLVLVACSIISLLQIVVLRISWERMNVVIKSAFDDWSSIVEPEARRIMKKHAYLGRTVFIYQTSSVALTIVLLIMDSPPSLFLTLPILENFTNYAFHDNYNFSSQLLIGNNREIRQRNLPMGTDCFVADSSTIVYLLVYFLQVVQLLATCACYVSTDVYFFTITMHVCGQFELLNIEFAKFGDNCENSQEKIGKLVERHNHLITLSNNFEKTFNILLMAQLSANAIHMGLLGLAVVISIKTGDGVVMVNAIVAIFILSLQLLLYCYAGDCLTTQIDEIRYATYCCRWYYFSPRIVKDLIFVMSRSNRTFNLTAGKVLHMNMYNFTNIFKAMASYFSMLKLMFDV